jgi:hypothetical protein
VLTDPRPRDHNRVLPRQDRIRDTIVLEKTGTVSFIEKIAEACLMWFEYVCRKSLELSLRTVGE